MALPLAQVERIMRNAGAERVTEKAVRRMQESATGIAEEVAGDAVALAREDGRESVTVEDVRRAVEA